MSSQEFRILLVEDDQSDAHLAIAILHEVKLGDDACHVTDGAMALDFLLARGDFVHRPPGLPFVVLLDLKLPRMNGFEVLQKVRAMPSLRHVPIVVMSSSGEARDVQRAYDLGANGYVVKSINFDAYRSSLHAIGNFWGTANEPPPGCLRPRKNVTV
jgi:two-component system, response regulator